MGDKLTWKPLLKQKCHIEYMTIHSFRTWTIYLSSAYNYSYIAQNKLKLEWTERKTITVEYHIGDSQIKGLQSTNKNGD